MICALQPSWHCFACVSAAFRLSTPEHMLLKLLFALRVVLFVPAVQYVCGLLGMARTPTPLHTTHTHMCTCTRRTHLLVPPFSSHPGCTLTLNTLNTHTAHTQTHMVWWGGE